MNLGWLLLIGFLLAFSAFLSLAETSLVGISKLRLHHMVEQGMKRALGLQQLIRRMDQVLTSIILADSFTNTAVTAMGTALCIAWLGPQWGVLVATFLMGTVIILLGEIAPKVFAFRHAERVALAVTPWTRALVWVLRPVTSLFTFLSNTLLRLMGVETKPRSPLLTEEELKLMIELGRKEGLLEEHERMLLHRIFEFGDLKVKDVMIPSSHMVTVAESASHAEVLRVLTEEGHSRIPVYRGQPDQVIGVIYAQEILHIWQEGNLIILQDLIHPPFTVSPDQRVSDLLQEFQRKHVQIAMVVGGEGRALGLVTLEDLIEEIVGEIH